MPVYEYECGDCGPFTALRPMAECAEPQTCVGCGAPAPRAFLSAPALARMDGGLRKSHAVNERSANEPRRASGTHGANCGCCTGRSLTRTKAAQGAKSFPNARPWMISH